MRTELKNLDGATKKAARESEERDDRIAEKITGIETTIKSLVTVKNSHDAKTNGGD